MTGRQRVLALLDGHPVDHLPLMPITMMFAAAIAEVKYRDYVTDYRVLCQAQVATSRKFGFDHVSVISDPARDASDLGAEIAWFDNQPPAIVEDRSLLADKSKLGGLSAPAPLAAKRMLDRVQAVAWLHRYAGREKIVEGWVEGPCAMAADLRGINALMLDFTDDPDFVHDLVQFVVDMELGFAQAQVDAGADIIGVGDAASSLISPKMYHEFVYRQAKRLIGGIHDMGARVRLHICGRTRQIFPHMARLGADIVDLDSMAPLDEARREMGSSQVLLGNVDPVRVLHDGTPQTVRTAFAECHYLAGPRYIVGAGCEIPPGTPDANVLAMSQYARAHQPSQFD